MDFSDFYEALAKILNGLILGVRSSMSRTGTVRVVTRSLAVQRMTPPGELSPATGTFSRCAPSKATAARSSMRTLTHSRSESASLPWSRGGLLHSGTFRRGIRCLARRKSLASCQSWGSYSRNFEGIALNGIVPGGPTPSGSSGLDRPWRLSSSSTSRPLPLTAAGFS